MSCGLLTSRAFWHAPPPNKLATIAAPMPQRRSRDVMMESPGGERSERDVHGHEEAALHRDAEVVGAVEPRRGRRRRLVPEFDLGVETRISLELPDRQVAPRDGE